MADADSTAATPVPLCAKCDEFPCAPKLKGQGLSIYCRRCRDKANEKVQRQRRRKKMKLKLQQLKLDLSQHLKREMETMEKRLLRRFRAIATPSAEPSIENL